MKQAGNDVSAGTEVAFEHYARSGENALVIDSRSKYYGRIVEAWSDPMKLPDALLCEGSKDMAEKWVNEVEPPQADHPFYIVIESRLLIPIRKNGDLCIHDGSEVSA